MVALQATFEKKGKEKTAADATVLTGDEAADDDQSTKENVNADG